MMYWVAVVSCLIALLLQIPILRDPDLKDTRFYNWVMVWVLIVLITLNTAKALLNV
jgi:hypothetical protein